MLSCNGAPKDIIPSSEFAPYINAYTGGIISQHSTIRIELTQDQPIVDLNQELESNPFRFSPSLKGKTYWINNHTLEFIPEEGALEPGRYYEATFRLSDFMQTEKRLKEFNFSFRVQKNCFSIQTEALAITQSDVATLKGTICFSNLIDKELTKKVKFTDTKQNKSLPVNFMPTSNPAQYLFEINDIPRKEEDYTLDIEIDASDIGYKENQTTQMDIPARNTFRFLSAKRIQQPENGIEVAFSEPISTTQNLKGLIEIPEVTSCAIQVKGNIVYLYIDNNYQGKLTLNLHKGIKSNQDKPLGTSHSIAMAEANLKPQVEFLSQSAILPDSKRLIVPFRSVSLYAVDISIIRIFESNLLMYLQTNTLSSSNELRRSGRLVYQNTLWLGEDKNKDIHRWEDYSVDLSGLIKQEPGALYRVILSFKQAYSAYPCSNDTHDSNLLFAESSNGMKRVQEGNITPEEDAQWDVPYSYYYYNGGIETDWSLYKWEERNNPCHPSYYMDASRVASCNVYASNVGMSVKRNSLNKLWITVNDILTTRPISNAKVCIYNFQLQPIGTAETDSEGFAEITPQEVPFLATATVKEEKAYVRLADGEEQSTSRFDVGGKDIQKGLKGFIYGERGVWRPGDTLHLSFILEDKQKRIPDRHPVSLELYTPRGQFYAKNISTQGLDGFYTFHVATRQEDPTGLWHAYIKVGGSTFHKSVRIETIKPNRLKINLQLPASPLQASPNAKLPVTLTSAWLTGATASNLTAKVDMSLSRVNTQFKGYEQYLFNNPASEFNATKTEVFNGKLDNNGEVNFLLNLPQAAQAPGLLNATLTARVFEPGGDASLHIQNAVFSPYTSYVGIRLNQPKDKYLETDKEHRFDIVTLTPDGKLTNRPNLEYRIYKIDWNWWWENRQDESFGTYINSTTITPVQSGNLQTQGGKAQITFRINYPEWGRYLVYVKDKDSGHATGGTVYIDWPDWRGRSSKTDPTNLKMLTFTLDKESYAPGDEATAIIPASAGGRALISIENGSNVLHREWIDMKEGKDAKYSFKITPDMAPNVYLHICLLQPHSQTTNDLPIRMYGVMPVFVKDPNSVLQPQIDMPTVLRPESDFKVTVSEAKGKPMTYTLAIVDEGLLDLTNFKTPDAWNEFYAREALGIRTWDMYDDVLGAKVGRYPAMFSTGGDETLKPADAKVNRFKPVVRFIGPFHLGKNRKQTHTLRLPMYIGAVRTMVVAGYDGAYGKTECTSQVRSPLMLLPTLPRILSTQEEILVPVNVFGMEKDVKSATVSIQATGDVQIKGKAQQTITFQQPGDTLICFTLQTGNRTGKSTIKFTAQGGNHRVQETVEIAIRNPNPVVTQRSGKWIEPGQTVTLPYSLPDVNAPDNSIRMEVSRIPSVDICRRIDFLYNYTHQCTEQLISKAMPLLYLNRYKDLDNAEKTLVNANIQEGIQKLYTRQLNNGGFAYWPEDAFADEWITSYAGMFLVLAKEAGYAVQSSVLKRWKDSQSNAARLWRISDEEAQQQTSYLQQAFRLYTLALAGSPEYGAMNRMKELPELPLQSRWMLAAAYAVAGQQKVAGEIAYNLSTTLPQYPRQNTVYGSAQRDEALVLEALVRMNRMDEARAQARRVSENLRKENAFDTQSTAFALMAMGHLAEQLSGTLNFTWQLGKNKSQEVQSTKPVFIAQIPATAAGTVTLTNHGEGSIDTEIVTRYQPMSDILPAQSNGLHIDVKYTDASGRALSPEKGLRQGSDLTATITVSNLSATQDYDQLALTHILPSGWEVQGGTAHVGGKQSGYDYRDMRDDRVLTYFTLHKGERKSFILHIQATYAGTFILPSIQCEDMYDPSVMARTQAGRTTVIR